MTRRVFFSFHYAKDAMKVSQVRNCWLFGVGHQAQPFLDKAQWEQLQRTGDAAVRKWIDDQMSGTSVTVVLIGTQTYTRPWVHHEILKSYDERRGLVGISLRGMKGFDGVADWTPCPDPFPSAFAKRPLFITPRVPVYDWVYHDGRNNISSWIETAARSVGR